MRFGHFIAILISQDKERFLKWYPAGGCSARSRCYSKRDLVVSGEKVHDVSFDFDWHAFEGRECWIGDLARILTLHMLNVCNKGREPYAIRKFEHLASRDELIAWVSVVGIDWLVVAIKTTASARCILSHLDGARGRHARHATIRSMIEGHNRLL